MAGTAIVTIIGSIAKEPENVKDGVLKCIIPVSIGKDEKQHTDWYNVYINPNTPAARLNNWLKKGSCVVVSGKLKADIWMDKSNTPHCGLNVMANSIDFGPSKREQPTEEQVVQQQNDKYNGTQPQPQSNVKTDSTPNFEPSNDLPFNI